MLQRRFDAKTGQEITNPLPLAMPPEAGSPQKGMAGLMDKSAAQPNIGPKPNDGRPTPPATTPTDAQAQQAQQAMGGPGGPGGITADQAENAARGGAAGGPIVGKGTLPPPVAPPPAPMPPVPMPPVTSLPGAQGGQLFDAKKRRFDAFSKGHVRVQKPESTARVEMFGGKDSPTKPLQQAQAHPTKGSVPDIKPAKAPKIAEQNPGLTKASKTPKIKMDAAPTGAGSQGSYKQQGDTWTDAKKKTAMKKPVPGKGVTKPPVKQVQPQGPVQAIQPQQAMEPQFDGRKARKK